MRSLKKILLRLLKQTLFAIRSRLSPHQFFVLSSVVVGALSALAAIVLKFFVHTIGEWINYFDSTYQQLYLHAFFPIVGITLTVLYIKYGLKGTLSKGSSEIGYAIARKSSKLPVNQTYSHIVTSALTVGFGGSVGLESPMVSTGSAMGSNYGSFFNLSYKDRTVLLACGAASGIAAAFNAPIAGVLFAIEVLLTDATVAAFIPIIIAAATGALLSKIILAEEIILSFSLQQPFNYNNIHFYIILGLVAGFVALIYRRVLEGSEKFFAARKNNRSKIIIGGASLGIMFLIFPSLFGEGYESIKMLANDNPLQVANGSLIYQYLQNDFTILIFIGALVFIKVLAVGITLGSGGNGGNFGPSLFVGAYLGFAFARLINLSGIAQIPETNFTLVAMAGILSGVFYAPLCAIFLIAEITGGYNLIIPLMIVAALGLTVARYFEPLSMEGKKLAKLLNITADNRDHFLLSRLNLQDLLEHNFSEVRPDNSLRLLVRVISISRRNTFPVVTREGKLVGVVHLDHIREIIFNEKVYDTTFVNEVMTEAHPVDITDSLPTILKKFDDTRQWNLPVVKDNIYQGFLSKARILSEYRAELVKSV
ncbi:MAG TPA: chloride channel protein [Cyclobacteriaceae bacterium]|jgi:CIC family chloride channel protein|nr:chloride channel protein [Cyclobacteriaceae bacterium]HRF33771.1 chloride channel protein [Cyclobacteriaceae bacterium]